MEPLATYKLKNGILFGTMKGDTFLMLNSGEDTAKFARSALEAPQKFHGKDINIASEELSVTEIAETMSRVFDKRGKLQGTLYAME